MGNQQGPIVHHRELRSTLCGSLDGRGVLGRVDTYICMAESLQFTWNYDDIVNTPIQSKKLKIKEKKEGIRRNHAEKYNHWNEKFTRVTQQMWLGKNHRQRTWKWNNRNYTMWMVERRKMKEMEQQDLWGPIKVTNIGIREIQTEKRWWKPQKEDLTKQ